MAIMCDICKQKNKGHYLAKEYEGRIITLCDDCRLGRRIKRSGKNNREYFEHFSTPFWKILGLKAKPNEIAKEKWMKWKNLTYGDLRMIRDTKEARYQGAYRDFVSHVNKYGRKDAPVPEYKKAQRPE